MSVHVLLAVNSRGVTVAHQIIRAANEVKFAELLDEFKKSHKDMIVLFMNEPELEFYIREMNRLN